MKLTTIFASNDIFKTCLPAVAVKNSQIWNATIIFFLKNKKAVVTVQTGYTISITTTNKTDCKNSNLNNGTNKQNNLENECYTKLQKQKIKIDEYEKKTTK